MKVKANKINYSKAMLPRTRKAQFGDCFKMNYLVLLKCGLVLFAFSLPLIAFSLFMDFYYVSLMNVVKEATQEEIEQTKNLYFYFLFAGLVVLSLPIIVSLSGVIHVLRNLIWGEGIFFGSDFVTGIKQNSLKNLLFSFILGSLLFLSFFITTLFDGLIVVYLPLIFTIIIFFPLYFWMLFLNNTYASKWTVLARNGFYFYIKTFGWSLLGLLMLFSLFGLILIPLPIIFVKYIILTLFIVFIFPIIFLIMVLYTTAKFDQEINQKHYPEYYLKGLNS